MDEVRAEPAVGQASDGIEKYRELYVMSKEILAEEHARFSRLDQKAANYLAALTLAFSIFGLVAASFLDKLPAHRDVLDWTLVALTVIIPVLFLLAWLKVFAVLKVQGVRRPPLGDELLRFYRDNRLIDIYYALAKGNSQALDENRAVADHKSFCLRTAYGRILAAVLGLGAFLLLFGVRKVMGSE